MKFLVSLFSAVAAVLVAAGSTFATPLVLNGHESDPNFVVYYPSGFHGIVGESDIPHEGEDLVMRAGQSGNFQQWFCGISGDESGIENHGQQLNGINGEDGDDEVNFECEHSVWIQLNPNQPCNGENAVLVPNAYPTWGDYLTPGADYCVTTNDFNVHTIPGL